MSAVRVCLMRREFFIRAADPIDPLATCRGCWKGIQAERR
jgi:hypothetical protein